MWFRTRAAAIAVAAAVSVVAGGSSGDAAHAAGADAATPMAQAQEQAQEQALAARASALTATQPGRTVAALPDRQGYLTTIRSADGGVTQILAAAAATLSESPGSQSAGSDGADGSAGPVHSMSAVVTLGRVTDAAPVVALSDHDSLQVLGVAGSDLAQVPATDATPIADPATMSPAVAAGSDQLYEHVCLIHYDDGGLFHLYGCADTFHVWTDGRDSHHWGMETRFFGTGMMHDDSFNADEVTGVVFGPGLHGGSSVSSFSPTEMHSLGSCHNTTIGVTLGVFTLSDTHESCPEKEGFYDVGPSWFKTKWDGDGDGPSDGGRTTHGVFSWYKPSGVDAHLRTLAYQYWWE